MMMRLEYSVDGCCPLSASSPASRYASSAPLRVELQRTPLKCWSSNVGVCWVGQGFKDTIWCCIKQASVCVLSTLEDQTNIYTIFTTSSVVRTVASLLQQIVLQVFPEMFFKQVETCFKKIVESIWGTSVVCCIIVDSWLQLIAHMAISEASFK